TPNRSRTLLAILPGALAPALLTGCARELANDLLLFGCVMGGLLAAFTLGLLVALVYQDEVYRFWQRIVTEEHHGDICRLTDAATEMAREAERAIGAAECALINLRARIPALTR
ncbi:MAG TPA: hypothetical protein VFO89_05460, partial [Thermoanaerobaculia bacterium]|nr:hypothetical protein [Thermoanaerobaculia bacterium]